MGPLVFFTRSLAYTDTRTPDSPDRSLDATPTKRWRQQRQVNKSGRPNNTIKYFRTLKYENLGIVRFVGPAV